MPFEQRLRSLRAAVRSRKGEGEGPIRPGRPRLTMGLILLGLVSLAMASVATTIAVTEVLRRTDEARGMASLEANMNVAWHLMHELGPQARLAADGSLWMGGTRLDGNLALVDELQALVGGVATVFRGDLRVATNVMNPDGTRGLGTRLASGPSRQAVIEEHRRFRGLTSVLGQGYYAAYDPIFDHEGRLVGILFVGLRQADFVAGVTHSRSVLLWVTIGALGVVGLAFAALTWRILRREAALTQASLHRDAALGNMSRGLLLYDAGGRLVLTNARFHAMCGLDRVAVHPGMTRLDVLRRMSAAGHFVGSSAEMMEEVVGRGLALGRPFVVEAEFSDDRLVEVERRPIAGGGNIVAFEDVTERRRDEARIRFLALHDVLTGLANRMQLRERINALLAEGCFALHCLDLDGFKGVNDTLGHPAGDELLQQVAERLRCCAGAGTLVARLGGDEFALVQSELAGPEDAQMLGECVAAVLREPFRIGEHAVSIAASIGIAIAPADGSTPDALLKAADLALYGVKSRGKGGWCRFDPALGEASRASRPRLEQRGRSLQAAAVHS